MRLLLLTAVLFPAAALAQGTCYSPSDCAAPQICSSLIDNIFPGTCIAGGEDPLYELQDVVPLESSSSSSSVDSSSSAAAPLPQPTLAEVSILSSISSSAASSESLSGAEGEDAEEGSTGNFFTMAFSGFVNGVKSVWCLFFCAEE